MFWTPLFRLYQAFIMKGEREKERDKKRSLHFSLFFSLPTGEYVMEDKPV